MPTRRWNPALTPPRWGWVAALVAFWWISELVGTVAFYAINQAANTYRAHADSIAIPIYMFALSSVFVIPVGSLLTWLALRAYPGSVTLWHWQKARPYWSGFWTLIAGWLMYEVARSTGTLTAGRWVDQITSGIFVYLVLVFRAILVARPRAKKQSQ